MVLRLVYNTICHIRFEKANRSFNILLINHSRTWDNIFNWFELSRIASSNKSLYSLKKVKWKSSETPSFLLSILTEGEFFPPLAHYAISSALMPLRRPSKIHYTKISFSAHALKKTVSSFFFHHSKETFFLASFQSGNDRICIINAIHFPFLWVFPGSAIHSIFAWDTQRGENPGEDRSWRIIRVGWRALFRRNDIHLSSGSVFSTF